MRDNDGARFLIAGASLVVLAIAVAFSKRKTQAMDAELPAPAVSPALKDSARAPS
jgi:hypothetical protein